ncbi:MAG: PQQ-binding-like beta-propeller repeat protein [Chloroflexi bacterium]|nr:PQQ-binding-like beta-propeller repeat protein [Chloroflexota bacterium]
MYIYIRRRLHLLLLLALTLLTLPACVGARMGVSWPAVGLIDLNGETQIALAYNNEVTLLTPSNGAPAGLVNPVDGSLLRDNQNNPRTWVLRGSDNGGAQFHTAPFRIDDETVIIVDHNRRLLRVDSVIVEVQRSFPLLDKVVANPLEAGGVLYVPFLNGGLSAISLDDYRELWRFPTDAGIWAQPLLVNDMLILSSIDHYLYAVDRETGHRIWSVDLGGAVASTPLLANDRLYIGSFNKSFFEISLDGVILSQYATQNWVWGTPAIDEYGIVYVTDLSGYVHALDTSGGLRERWSAQIAERGVRAGPIVYGERVIVASRDGKVYWLDRNDGQLINAREIDGRPELLGDMMLLEPSPTLAIDAPLLLVNSVDEGRLLIAFGIDGRQTWVYPR